MCGIAGILHFGRQPDAPSRLRLMADSIVHRGPDGEGYWSDADFALAFRRLAIVDIETGDQPMSNADGSVWVVFNGEIYNHVALRAELEARGHKFVTDHSDTEVLVHGWAEWGESLPERLNGMFAFCIIDRKKRSAFMARDRHGVKPLYLHERADGAILFGSEVRPIHASGLLPIASSPRAIIEYFSLMNQWHGRTPFTGVRMLLPGTWMRVDADGVEERKYWDFVFERKESRDMETASADFRELLLDTVDRQIAADVPVMAYLSGGIDSTSVTVAAYHRDPRVRAYSCIFDLDNVGVDAFCDEREFSRAAADFLGIDRVELELSQDTLVKTLDATIHALEYPRMGMAYVNYMIASRVAQDAKVVLSGMGGDEVTGGYVGRYWLVPHATRPAPGEAWEAAPGFKRSPYAPDESDPFNLYRVMLNTPIAKDVLPSAFTPAFLAQIDGFDPLETINAAIESAPSNDTWDTLMYVDAKTYLHGLLVLEDKLSMTHSLETRVPLLDNVLVDRLLQTSWGELCDGETGKILFREAVKPLVPESVYTKPKMGFGPPDASWYRGVLRPLLEERLSERRIAARGVFQPAWVRARLDEHFEDKANWVGLIWCLLSFDSWCEQYGLFGGKL